MKKIRKIIIMFIIASMITGCGKSGEKNKQGKISENDYRRELSSNEIESGKASFYVEDKLKIDADITKQKLYKNGLKSYYQKQYCETKIGTTNKFKNNPTVFHKNRKQIEKMLNQIIHGKLNYKEFVIEKDSENAPELDGVFSADNGSKYDCKTIWDTYNNALGHSRFFFCPQFIMEKQGSDADAINAIKYMTETDIKVEKTKMLTEIEKNAKVYKNWLEKFIGTSLDDKYRILELNKKTSKSLNDSELCDYKFKDKEYQMIMFYKKADEMAINNIDLSYVLKADEKPDKWAKTTMVRENLFTMTESPVYIIFCNGEIEYIEADIYRYMGEEYKNNQNIISPNKILKKVISFYEKELIVDEVCIKSINLEYAGYYGRDNNMVKPIFAPVWSVKVYDGEKKRMTYFVYDAVTGECYVNEYIPW